ncbi:MAG: acyl-CoA thioesterase [Ignavibacteriaceae bacterium]|nr:acyl-CoA thioesterase [Ignavibacteriaceae bacterium]
MAELKPEDFKHKTSVKVRFNEVDMLGVCNNAVYINFFEEARLEYIKEVGLMPAGGLFSDGKIFFMVRNEINYRAHSRYDDELYIYSRVSYIKNSSFGFDHLIVNAKTNQVIADGGGVVVNIDPKNGKSTELSDDVYKKISEFEKNVKIIKNN